MLISINLIIFASEHKFNQFLDTFCVGKKEEKKKREYKKKKKDEHGLCVTKIYYYNFYIYTKKHHQHHISIWICPTVVVLICSNPKAVP